MEYMRLDGVLSGAVSRLINKGLEVKVGYNPNIRLDNFIMKAPGADGDSVEVSMNLSMSQADFNKFIEEATR